MTDQTPDHNPAAHDPSDLLPVPLLLEAAASPDGETFTVTYTLGGELPNGEPHTASDVFPLAGFGMSAVLTGEHPTPRALLILFAEGAEVARFLIGRALADILPGLLTAFPDLPRIHPAQLAAFLRSGGYTLIYPVPGLPDCPSLFPTEQDAAAALMGHNAVMSTVDKLLSLDEGQDPEPLTPAEQETGAALLARVRELLEQEQEPEPAPIPPEQMN